MENKEYDKLSKHVMSLLEKDGPDTALSYLDDYIKKNPNFLEAHLVRGEVYTEKGDFQESLSDFEKAIKIDPKISLSYFLRGMLYAKLGDDINKAFNDFNKAIELDNNFADAYANRGNMYLKMRELDKAIADCSKAIELSSGKMMEAYFNRGLAYANMGEVEKSLDDYNMVLKIEPENAEALARRGSCNNELGNTQEAICDFEKFLEIDPDNKNAKLVRDELKKLKSDTTASSDECYEVVTAKKEIKIILICSAIGFIFGTIIGASSGNVLLGMWFGIGFGSGISLLSEFPSLFAFILKKDGFIEAIKTTVGGGAILFALLLVAGPIGLLVRVLKKNNQIKKFQDG